MANQRDYALERIDQTRAAKAVLSVAAILGSVEDWSGDQLEYIADAIRLVVADAGLPSFEDQSDEGIEYWERLL